jgi:Protein of unknown function (DUF3309)
LCRLADRPHGPTRLKLPVGQPFIHIIAQTKELTMSLGTILLIILIIVLLGGFSGIGGGRFYGTGNYGGGGLGLVIIILLILVLLGRL